MANPLDNIIKNKYLNQYAGATSGLNQPVTMTDSPIFQAGVQNWDPTSLATTGAEIMLPLKNIYSKLAGSDTVTYGLAGLGSGAAFKQMPENPTGIEQLKFADVFGHEMSHLGWDYKPKGEGINVPGVRQEGTKASAVKAGLGDPGDPNKYLGEEQWNYMHDLMYGPRKEYSSDFGNLTYKEDINTLQEQLGSGTITPSVFKAEVLNILDKTVEPTYTPGYNYLTDRGLINKGDLSYTPKAYNEIAWSGLTTPSKQAIGFGINPFEDTRAAGQFYKQQTAAKQFKQQQLMNQRKQDMQRQIREAEAAKQKAAADAKAKADAAAHKEAQATGGDYHSGHESTVGGQHTDWGPMSHMIARGGLAQRAPRYANGGLIDFFRYGGFIG